jgi:hypothetical protein
LLKRLQRPVIFIDRHTISKEDQHMSASSPTYATPHPLSKPRYEETHDHDEETKGLLSDSEGLAANAQDVFSEKDSRPWRKNICIGALLVTLLLGVYGAVMGYSRSQNLARAKALHFDGDEVRSNGTHDFKRTVLLVSIDGLRYVLFGFYGSCVEYFLVNKSRLPR